MQKPLPIIRRARRSWRQLVVAAGSLALLALSPGQARAQADAYQFAATTGTYAPLPGTAPSATAVQADDAISDALPIGFSFSFDGIPYSSVYASSNGFLSFNSSATSSLTNNLTTGSGATQLPLLAPLWDDLGGELPNSAARYQTSGSAPNRVFTFEWQNWSWNYNATAAVVSFQVKLYETSNRVEFVYRPEGGAVNSPSASIGIAGTGTPVPFLSLSSTAASPTVSSSTETNSLSTLPAAGQIYAFTPPPATGCPTPRNLAVTSTTATSALVTWSVIGGGGTFSINYGPTGFTPGTGGQTITSTGTSVTIPGLSPSTNYQFYVTQLCSGSTSTRSNVGTFRTECVTPNYAVLPFNETFEGTWLDRCATRDVPGNNWRNTPLTGNNSWRREDDGVAANWGSPTSYAYTPTGSQSSAHSARFHSGSASVGLIGTMDLFANLSGAGSKRLSFDYINTTGSDSLTVQISTDGGLTFGPQLLRLGSAAGGFRSQNLTLTSTSATTVIRFRARADFGSTDIGLDNVRLESFSNCLSPLGLAVTSVTATTATVSWASAGTGTYTVFYGPTGFTPGGAGSQTLSGITGTSATIPGLTASTEYQFYVRQDCGGSTSANGGPVAFRTDCVTPNYATLPFSETFEGTWLDRCATRDVPSNNWRNTPLTGNNSWRREDDGVAANWGSPTSYAYTPTGSQSSAHSARFHSGSASSGLIGTMDLYVNLSGAGSRELAFDYINTTGSDSLTVQISTDGGATFGPQLLRLGSATGGFRGQTLALTSTSATTVIRFRARADFGTTDIGLDNVTISSCPRVSNVAVSNITGTTATVTFTPVAGSGGYTVVATPTTGPAVTVSGSNSPIQLTGLQGLMQYTVGVVSSCGTGQSSAPVTATFTTLLPPVSNDEPCTATVLPANGTALTTSNLGATASAANGYSNPGCAPAANPKDVWFSFVAPGNGPRSLVVTGAPAGQVRLFSATSCNGPFTQLACRASTGSGTAAGSLALPALTPGTTYYVSVSGYGSSDAQGAFTIALASTLSTGMGQLPSGEVSVFPTPHQGGPLTLRLRGVEAGVSAVRVELLNALGQQVMNQELAVRGGALEQALPVQNLAKGFYTMRVQVGKHTVTRKVVLE
ncbi:fibronectin type III domain-containing protein [Hymenobacter yonginensis]|uniref:Fibronectin type III domain-containing protein n=1 Tax=Hymenobacter yonginensis TaxID=748197 RepID=A0ABY7PQG0_9BACT|nr:fibronectin type III domain-containing protein [Hymenobacter yonginensis]WBO85059.1 fibronectin type III domain-containing protein [Hymenobacter yonginensis]